VPKIDAPTVAEHRANQEHALLDAARALLLAGGRAAVTPAAVGAAVGLARSSVYRYFRTGEEILARMAADAFADWGTRVCEAVNRDPDAGARIDAYARATLELAGSGAHRVAVLAGDLPRDGDARQRLAQAHHDLAAPLRAALADYGDPDPGLTAELVDGALSRAIGQLDAGRPAEDIVPATLAFVRRAVGVACRATEAPGKPENEE
jgi:AcrR family transcriptional regulator